MTTPEFSRPVAVEGLVRKDLFVEADPDERAALARRFAIVAVDRLEAEVCLERQGGGQMIRLSGRLRADVVQICVVSLEPVAGHLEEDFEMTFAHERQPEAADVVVDLDDPDPPDPIEDGRVDIGEAVAEQLALILDPFPRAPGARFENDGREAIDEPSAFAALAAWNKK
jgi:uncharacterized metal-binding protein YceD (DUF177 family)